MFQKGFGRKPDIFPLKIYTEPSYLEGQIRLCLGHVETDKAVIVETYLPDEIAKAERKFRAWLVQHPKAVSLNDIENWSLSKMGKIPSGVKMSRSTKEMKPPSSEPLIFSVLTAQTPL
ncbi:MAG: hypothetical protein KME10_11465 [Plectolyngbya sp. WJT66-NPBG17]|jgi:hypothetical protein|nr:hypothetical protein [Plectolyngbya sp. WJT66-NPBG17]